MALPYTETWTGSNGASWSGDWTTTGATAATATISSNRGHQYTGTTASYGGYVRSLLTDQAAADFDLTVEFRAVFQAEQYPVVGFRGDGSWASGSPAWPNNGYGLELKVDNTSTNGWWTIDRVDSGTRTNVSGGPTAYTITNSDVVYLNVRCVGTAVEFRIWKNAESKPGSATFSFTDSTHNTRTRHSLGINGGGGSGYEIDFDNLSIVAPGSTDVLNPDADVTVNSWITQAGGTSNLYQAIDETAASDADYVASPVGSSSHYEASLESGSDPSSSSGHVVHYRYSKAGSASCNLTVSLRQGASTEIASWTHNGISAGWTTADQTLDGSEADAITDYTDLRLRFAPQATTGTPAKVQDISSNEQDLSSGTTTTVDVSANTTAGNTAILRVAVDNSASGGAAPGLTVTDTKSNVWTVLGPGLADPGAANAGSACYIAYAPLETALTTSDDITLTWGTAATAKAVVAEEWEDIDTVTPVATAAINTSGSTGTMSIGPIAPTAANQLVYAALSTEGPTGDTAPADTDTTNGSWSTLTRLSTGSGTAAANQTVAGQYKVVTTTGNQTWNATITARDWAAVMVVFNEGGSRARVSWANLEIPTVTADTADGETATAAGAGQNAAVRVSTSAATGTATGTANNATAGSAVTATGTTATATGTANNATATAGGASVTANGQLATASGVSARQLLDESGNPLLDEAGGYLYDEAGPVVDATISTASVDTADGETATASGQANNGAVSVQLSSSTATATGAGQNATVATAVTATGTTATATSEANGANGSVTLSTSTGAATGTANNATAGQADTADGELAAATGAGHNGSLVVAAAGQTGTATATGLDATVTTAVTATGQTATAAGAAFDGTAAAESADTADGETATATGTAANAALAVTINGSVGAAVGQAFDGSVTVNQPGVASGQTAAAAAAAGNAAVSVAVSSSTGTATGTANNATAGSTRTADGGTGTATGLAYTATISITAAGQVTVAAGEAFNGSAGQAVTATGQTATATGGGFDASVTVEADVTATGQTATATGQAFNAPVTGTDRLAERGAHRRGDTGAAHRRQLALTGHRRP